MAQIRKITVVPWEPETPGKLRLWGVQLDYMAGNSGGWPIGSEPQTRAAAHRLEATVDMPENDEVSQLLLRRSFSIGALPIHQFRNLEFAIHARQFDKLVMGVGRERDAVCDPHGTAADRTR